MSGKRAENQSYSTDELTPNALAASQFQLAEPGYASFVQTSFALAERRERLSLFSPERRSRVFLNTPASQKEGGSRLARLCHPVAWPRQVGKVCAGHGGAPARQGELSLSPAAFPKKGSRGLPLSLALPGGRVSQARTRRHAGEAGRKDTGYEGWSSGQARGLRLRGSPSAGARLHSAGLSS